MNVGELINLLSELPDNLPVAIGTTQAGKFGSFHIQNVAVEQRHSRAGHVVAECPECGDRHRHRSTTMIVDVPKHVRLGTTIDPVPVRVDNAPPAKLFGRWPRRALEGRRQQGAP